MQHKQRTTEEYRFSAAVTRIAARTALNGKVDEEEQEATGDDTV